MSSPITIVRPLFPHPFCILLVRKYFENINKINVKKAICFTHPLKCTDLHYQPPATGLVPQNTLQTTLNSFSATYDSNNNKIIITVDIIISSAIKAGDNVWCVLTDDDPDIDYFYFCFVANKDFPSGIKLTYSHELQNPFPDNLGGGAKLADLINGNIAVNEVALIARDANNNEVDRVTWDKRLLFGGCDNFYDAGIGTYFFGYTISTTRNVVYFYLRVRYSDGTSYEMPVLMYTFPVQAYSTPTIPITAGIVIKRD